MSIVKILRKAKILGNQLQEQAVMEKNIRNIKCYGRATRVSRWAEKQTGYTPKC
jgi:hypothetical protein